MNEQDLRNCFAMFKSITGASPEDCYRFADEMLLARDKIIEVGIAAIKKRKYDKVNEKKI